MRYQVKLHPNVERFLSKLPQQLDQRIRERLRRLETDQYRYLEQYIGDYYKFRIGSYRALIDVLGRTVLVRFIDHRRRIYKRFGKK